MSDDPFMPCTCPHIKQGSEVTEFKNWNPDCAEHGVDSSLYRSEEQVLRRERLRKDLIENQRRAREKRQEKRT